MGRLKKQRGFTIVELMVVISIIAILAVIAALSADFIRKEQVASATKELLADLQQTRVEAMTAGPSTAIPQMRGSGIKLTSSSAYALFKFNDCNEDYVYGADTCTGSKPEEAEARTVAMPSSIELLRFDGTNLVTPTGVAADMRIFDRYGMPRAADTWAAVGSTVLVLRHRSAGHTKCIAIETNKVREGAWNGTSCAQQ